MIVRSWRAGVCDGKTRQLLRYSRHLPYLDSIRSYRLPRHMQMVPFAGYELPVQYPDGVLKSHKHTRAEGCASLFDVGHMGQIKWHGKDRAKFLETVCVADVQGLPEGHASLTLLTTEQGGIIDDSIVTNHGNYTWVSKCRC